MGVISGLLVMLLFLGIVGGVITMLVLGQVYLSKKESPWLGLILPIISFSLSMLIILAIVLFAVAPSEVGPTQIHSGRIYLFDEDFQNFPPERHERFEEEGILAPQTEVSHLVDYGTIGAQPARVSLVIGVVFVVFNIPTGILLIIYFSCRGKRRKQRALDIMSVQDLG